MHPAELAKLLRQPTPAQHAAVVAKVEQTLETLHSKLNLNDGPYRMPRIAYDVVGANMGMFRPRTTTLALNLDYFDKYHDEMLLDTVPHETCHYVQRIHWPKSSHHGYEWQRLMVMIGLPPNRTGSAAPIYARGNHSYECEDCHKTFNFSSRRHNSVRRGRRYICSTCGGSLVASTN